ncbi:P-loop containing nucleoside triphosphate hydrolase protein [Cercophora newfieldiana]|uniref:P-loop containing nucleoside triphosphate hydrolase protein n=1 Tax=Cercophora newfieldiana TaxID=92897 RepID=A0AA39YI71_9PEZI|nr:P-loop containing nucleoside triphosphate hydrolase protein [Cercophora newfieldiana]
MPVSHRIPAIILLPLIHLSIDSNNFPPWSSFSEKNRMPVLIVLFGPSGSGKSQFVKHVTGQAVNTGVAGGAKPCTTECKRYDITLKGEDFIIIDTPGFEDSPPGSIKPLVKIARTLQAIGSSEITGAVYFHRITDGRLTGSLRSNLEIFRQICGEDFFPRVAFATTMWDIVGQKASTRYENINQELGRRYLRFGETGPEIFKCSNNEASCRRVLDHFSNFASTAEGKTPAQLLLLKELSSKSVTESSVRKTSAGREAMRKTGGNRGGLCVIL